MAKFNTIVFVVFFIYNLMRLQLKRKFKKILHAIRQEGEGV